VHIGVGIGEGMPERPLGRKEVDGCERVHIEVERHKQPIELTQEMGDSRKGTLGQVAVRVQVHGFEHRTLCTNRDSAQPLKLKFISLGHVPAVSTCSCCQRILSIY
jgi:hypothetical protein